VAAKKTDKVSGSAKATIDHDEIRDWVEEHGGHPAMVKSTARDGRGGILRIDFPGFSGARTLEEVSWEEFFDKFEESELAFLYQDQTRSARPSRFNKLVSRASLAEDGRSTSPGARAKKAPRRASPAAATTKKQPATRRGPTQNRSSAPRSTSGSGARRDAGTPKKKTAAPSKRRAAGTRQPRAAE